MDVTLRRCIFWDFPAADAKRDLFYVGKSPTSPLYSYYIKFEQSGRRFGGVLPAGLADIHLQSQGARYVVIEQCNEPTNGAYFSVDAGNNYKVELRNMSLDTILTNNTSALKGTAVLSGGSVVVNTSAVRTDSKIFLTSQSDGGTTGTLRVSARTVGVNFTIKSTSATDTSTVAWMIVEPA